MNSPNGGGLAHSMAEAVARRSYGKLVAFFAARSGDVASAEDALSEAFTAALETWPQSGCPANPEAWLLTVARRKQIDRLRSRRRDEARTEDLRIMAEGLEAAAHRAELPDQRLALIFACAHPAVDAGVRAPLVLQTVLGFDAAMIASAFLVAPATMSQRLVRAKNKIRQAGIPFRVPEREELPERLGTVLDAIYAAFAEGWSDATGVDAVRRELAGEAIYLGRLVAQMLPEEPEALGLMALMLYAEARYLARRTPQGDYVPFDAQDAALWNAAMIDEAEALLYRACQMGAIGRYQLEAALQSSHIHRRRTGHANWEAVVQLYDALWALSASPVVAINRALAVAELHGAAAGLEALQPLAEDARLRDYQPWWATRANLLSRAGRHDEARHAYEIAIGLERDPAVRRFLQEKQAALGA